MVCALAPPQPRRCPPGVALPLPCRCPARIRRTPTRSANGPPRPYQQSTTTTNQPPMNQPPTTTAQSTVQSLNHCTRLPRTRTVMTNTNYLMFLFFFVSNYEVYLLRPPAARAVDLFSVYSIIHHYYFPPFVIYRATLLLLLLLFFFLFFFCLSI